MYSIIAIRITPLYLPRYSWLRTKRLANGEEADKQHPEALLSNQLHLERSSIGWDLTSLLSSSRAS